MQHNRARKNFKLRISQQVFQHYNCTIVRHVRERAVSLSPHFSKTEGKNLGRV